MPKKEEPRDKPAETERDRKTDEELSLVDYFDQMDRAAFRRSLEQRDSYFFVPSRG